MPELMDHVAYLSQEIGPRPAGTEEEQQAALYITEQMQKDAGLSAVIEDFNSASNAETPRAICCAITFVIALASLFLPVLAIPAMVLTALSAILYVLEVGGKPIISRFLARGVSQNVVAKYEPGYSADAGGARRRKVILVARYDSGKVQPELKAPILGVLPFIQWALLVSIVLIPILLIVRNVFFLHAEGVTAIVFFVLIGIGLFFTALPLVIAIVHKFSAYNEAANANAAGTAVLLDVARRIGRGRVSAAELAARAEADGTVVHGEEAAIASGLVPEGAQLAYQAAQMQPPEPAPQTPEDRLASAKAAIAALTGQPVSQSEPVRDIASNLVQVKEAPIGQPTEEDIKEQRDETREALAGVPSGEAPSQVVVEMLSPAAGGEGEAADSGAAAGTAVAAAGTAAAAAIAGSVVSPDSSSAADASVPDWFRKAQENAKKPRSAQPGEIHRSRYADALDAAVSESSSHFNQANRLVDAETEGRLKQMREGLLETRTAPPAPDAAMQSEASGNGIAVPEQFGENQQADAADLSAGSPDAPEPWVSAQPVLLQDAAQQNSAAPGSTTAMPPIDVSDLRAQVAGSVPPIAPIPPIETEQAKPAIVLPDIGMSATNLPPVIEMSKQRAPLAEAEQSSKVAAKSLLTMLPTIGAEEIAAEKDGKDPAQAHQDKAVSPKPDLGLLPSLSGEIRKPSTDEGTQAAGSVSKAGSFASMGMTGAFTPVGDELIENVDPDEIYVDDADDSDYESGLTETGAFAGPGYVEMPKSRVRRFFDRFGKKKKEEEVSPQEWLDVDENFEARSVGAARGGWESFQQDDSFDETDGYSEYDEFDENAAYGGDREIDEFDDDEFENGGNRPWQGGAFSRRRLVDQDEVLDEGETPVASQVSSEAQVSDELQQVYQFRNPDVNVEVWFVALGSELAGNAGMKAFLAEHGTELRGSVIINLNALGAGDLSLIEKEGKYRRVSASSRMKRYMKKASQATGIDSSTASIKWSESASSVALRHGFQAMSVVGMDGSKPAYFGQGDDVLENIDPDTLYRNSDFVMELLKNI